MMASDSCDDYDNCDRSFDASRVTSDYLDALLGRGRLEDGYSIVSIPDEEEHSDENENESDDVISIVSTLSGTKPDGSTMSLSMCSPTDTALSNEGDTRSEVSFVFSSAKEQQVGDEDSGPDDDAGYDDYALHKQAPQKYTETGKYKYMNGHTARYRNGYHQPNDLNTITREALDATRDSMPVTEFDLLYRTANQSRYLDYSLKKKGAWKTVETTLNELSTKVNSTMSERSGLRRMGAHSQGGVALTYTVPVVGHVVNTSTQSARKKKGNFSDPDRNDVYDITSYVKPMFCEKEKARRDIKQQYAKASVYTPFRISADKCYVSTEDLLQHGGFKVRLVCSLQTAPPSDIRGKELRGKLITRNKVVKGTMYKHAWVRNNNPSFCFAVDTKLELKEPRSRLMGGPIEKKNRYSMRNPEMVTKSKESVFLDVDLGRDCLVTAVSTQGQHAQLAHFPDSDYLHKIGVSPRNYSGSYWKMIAKDKKTRWVKRYRLLTRSSESHSQWVEYGVLQGNTNWHQEAVNQLEAAGPGIRCRYIRFAPLKHEEGGYHNGISMRVGVYGFEAATGGVQVNQLDAVSEADGARFVTYELLKRNEKLNSKYVSDVHLKRNGYGKCRASEGLADRRRKRDLSNYVKSQY